MRFALAAMAVLGCAPPAPTGANPVPTAAAEEPNLVPSWLTTVSDEIAPVPFPAAVLASELKVGTELTYRFAERDEEPYLLTYEFIAASADGAIIKSTRRPERTNASGGTATETKSSWKELESHAHFKRSATRINSATARVPAGRFATARYQVIEEDGPSTTITTYWFARSEPGPPVRMIKDVDGDRVLEMALTARRRPR